MAGPSGNGRSTAVMPLIVLGHDHPKTRACPKRPPGDCDGWVTGGCGADETLIN